MTILNTFANQSGQIPLSQLDSNFATPITIGTTPIILGDIATTITGLTLAGADLGTPTGNLANCIFPTLNQNTTGTATNVTGIVAVANGGTGVTTSTGTGSTVLSASPTFTGTLNSVNLAYTGTLTGGTGILNIGSGQVYKDASGNVGIGTSSPGTKLELSTYSNTVIRMTNSVEANYRAEISSVYSNESFVLSGGSGYKLIAAEGYNIPNVLKFYTANTERMRIDASGSVTLQGNISVGGAAPTTVGTGVTFPAAESASSNANTLDDYEEGGWTPVLTFVTNGTMTYTASSESGVYTKIGNVVTCRVNLVLSAFTAGTASGQARISLPIQSANNNFTATVYSSAFTNLFPTFASSANAASIVALSGITAINTAPAVITPANFTATSSILFSITYRT